MSSIIRFAQISDIHLGRPMYNVVHENGVNIREYDAYVIFEKAVTEIIESGVEFVLVPGDTFDRPMPNIRSMVFAQEQFRRFADANIKVVGLAGNHDTNDVLEDVAASKILHDAYRGIYSFVEPYKVVEIIPNVFVHAISHHGFLQQDETMSKIKPVDGAINILTTHGSCVDPILEMVLHTEQSPREVVLPDKLITGYDWDAVLLGHIHERRFVKNINDSRDFPIYYNGSTYRRGFSDGLSDLGIGWTLWSIDTSTKVFSPVFKNIPQRPQYDFPLIDASGFSSSDLTDIILGHLKTTQVTESNDFDASNAPLLRQKIINISTSQYAGLDMKEIDRQRKHALYWKLEPTFKHTVVERDFSDSSKDFQKNVVVSSDLVEIFDSWKSNSKTLGVVDESIRGKVIEQSKNFVRLGQDKILSKE